MTQITKPDIDTDFQQLSDAAGSTYALVVAATVGAYIAGNVIQKKNDALADK